MVAQPAWRPRPAGSAAQSPGAAGGQRETPASSSSSLVPLLWDGEVEPSPHPARAAAAEPRHWAQSLCFTGD